MEEINLNRYVVILPESVGGVEVPWPYAIQTELTKDGLFDELRMFFDAILCLTEEEKLKWHYIDLGGSGLRVAFEHLNRYRQGPDCMWASERDLPEILTVDEWFARGPV